MKDRLEKSLRGNLMDLDKSMKPGGNRKRKILKRNWEMYRNR